jgi:hypothetical protein
MVLLSSLWSHYLPTKSKNHAANGKRLEEQLERCERYCNEWDDSCEGPLRVDCGDLPSFNISFTYDPTIQLYTDEPKPILRRWADFIGKHNISLLIMNTGAHYQPDNETLVRLCKHTIHTSIISLCNTSIISPSSPLVQHTHTL